MQKKLLIIGKRGGILQWYENILAAAHQSPDYEIQGFALNHNNTTDRFSKKAITKQRYIYGKFTQKETANVSARFDSHCRSFLF